MGRPNDHIHPRSSVGTVPAKSIRIVTYDDTFQLGATAAAPGIPGQMVGAPGLVRASDVPPVYVDGRWTGVHPQQGWQTPGMIPPDPMLLAAWLRAKPPLGASDAVWEQWYAQFARLAVPMANLHVVDPYGAPPMARPAAPRPFPGVTARGSGWSPGRPPPAPRYEPPPPAPPKPALHPGWSVLGLTPGAATAADVRAAHRRRVQAVHPDAHPTADAATRAALERETADLNTARDALLQELGAR